MKKYDIAIKAGEYQNAQGETKARWVNIGAMIENDKGPFLLLDPGINLAAYMEPGKDRVIASMFQPRQQGQQGQPQQNYQQPPQQQQAPHGQQPPADDFGDSIPF